LAADKARKWYGKSELRVMFLGVSREDPHPDEVLKIANEWAEHTGIPFVRVGTQYEWFEKHGFASDIRVKFGCSDPLQDESLHAECQAHAEKQLAMCSTQKVWADRLGVPFAGLVNFNGSDKGRNWTPNGWFYNNARRARTEGWGNVDNSAWSFVGSDAQNTIVTLNLGFQVFATLPSSMSDRREWRRVVLHEFGHALGFQHENPGHVPYDKQKVIEFYAQPSMGSWSAVKTQSNVFDPNENAPLMQETWDKHSIMSYSVPEGLLDKSNPDWHHYVHGSNYDLSESDKARVAEWYK
jgi:hypothetical protein